MGGASSQAMPHLAMSGALTRVSLSTRAKVLAVAFSKSFGNAAPYAQGRCIGRKLRAMCSHQGQTQAASIVMPPWLLIDLKLPEKLDALQHKSNDARITREEVLACPVPFNCFLYSVHSSLASSLHPSTRY